MKEILLKKGDKDKLLIADTVYLKPSWLESLLGITGRFELRNISFNNNKLKNVISKSKNWIK